MALKRLMKEWECWDQQSPNAAMQALGSFEEQRQLWMVKPQLSPSKEPNYFIWDAELQVSSGPLKGASLVYSIQFPTDYPFKPPTMRPEFAGFPVQFGELQQGWYVFMVPPRSTGQRQKGQVTVAGDSEITVQWIKKGEMGDDDDDEEAEGEVDVISLSSFEGQTSPVLGQSHDGEVYHPLLDTSGIFCSCGIRDKWAPHFTILTCLSFAHSAIEDPTNEDGMRPVPAGSSNEMCFCTVNPGACQDFQDGQWQQLARRRFFTEKGVAPLCVSASLGEAPEGSCCIECTSLAGTQLGKIQMDCQKTMEDLEKEIQEKIPMKETGVAWKIVLPDGACVSEHLRYRSIGSIFNLH